MNVCLVGRFFSESPPPPPPPLTLFFFFDNSHLSLSEDPTHCVHHIAACGGDGGGGVLLKSLKHVISHMYCSSFLQIIQDYCAIIIQSYSVYFIQRDFKHNI